MLNVVFDHKNNKLIKVEGIISNDIRKFLYDSYILFQIKNLYEKKLISEIEYKKLRGNLIYYK
jgi:hypothetical protein